MKVKIYTTPTCPYCKQAKDFFRENNIEFEEVDVAGDTKAAEAMLMNSGQLTVPQIEIDDELFIGFDQKALSDKLGIGN